MSENIENKKIGTSEEINGGNARTKKILKISGIFLLIVFATMWYIGYFSPEYIRTIPERTHKWAVDRYEKNASEAIEKQITALREKYQNDFDGGKTPEKTLDLYLAALRAGDIEKASKYYEFSVQEKALASLKKEFMDRGDLNQSIEYTTEVYKKGNKKCNEKNDGCTFDYTYITTKDETVAFGESGDKLFVPAGSESSKFTDLTQNPFTKIWKITQPY